MAFSYVRIADFTERWSCTSSDTLPNTRGLAVSNLFCGRICSSVSRLAIRTVRWNKRSFHLQRAYVGNPHRLGSFLLGDCRTPVRSCCLADHQEFISNPAQ